MADKTEKQFEGQSIEGDHFTVVTGDALGRAVVSVRPKGWVGDDILTFPGWKIEDLIKSLKEVKNLPDSPEAPAAEPVEPAAGEEPPAA
jgi:hypothetical protein